MYFTYILECADKTLYVGSTNDLEKRLYSHNNLKSGAHYTKIRRPVVLKYFEKFRTYAKSRSKETEWKRMSRTDKLKLISHNQYIQSICSILRESFSISNFYNIYMAEETKVESTEEVVVATPEVEKETVETPAAEMAPEVAA